MFEELKEKYPRWMFMSVVGSQNYGTTTNNSDTDMKVAYLPTFPEFYHNSFTHADTGSPTGDDYTVHPAHEFLNHAFKGNMNFWEVVFYAPTFQTNLEFWENSSKMHAFFDEVRTVVKNNPLANFNAMRGMMVQKNKEAIRLHSSTCVDDDEKIRKAAQHSMRLFSTLVVYLAQKELVLDLRPYGIYNWLEWRSNHYSFDWEEYTKNFDSALKMLEVIEQDFIDWHNDPVVFKTRINGKNYVNRTMINLIRRNG